MGQFAEVYVEPSGTSSEELFVKTVSGIYSRLFSQKGSIVDV